MALVIAPLHKVENITTQAELTNFIRDHEQDSDVFVWRITNGNTAWGNHAGTMVVPENQYLTRFFFVAMETATSDKSVGNLLDNVHFSTTLPPPPPGKGRITVTKNVYGLDLAAAKANLIESFISYTAPNAVSGEITFGPNMWRGDVDVSGTPYVTVSYVIDNIDVPSNTTLTYAFAETPDNAQVGGYTLTPDAQLEKSVSLTKEDNDKSVAYTNTYSRLTVKKLVTGGLGDKTKDFSFSYSYEKDGETITESFTLRDDETKAIIGIPLGTVVTVTEDYSGSSYTTNYQEGGSGAMEGRECTETIAAGENSVTFVNHKDPPPDVGVLLDSWPYLIVLAAVVAGAIAFCVIRLRNRDDD